MILIRVISICSVCFIQDFEKLTLPAEMQCKELSRSSTLWHNRKVSIAIHSEWLTMFSLCLLLFLKWIWFSMFSHLYFIDYRRIQSAFSLCKLPPPQRTFISWTDSYVTPSPWWPCWIIPTALISWAACQPPCEGMDLSLAWIFSQPHHQMERG